MKQNLKLSIQNGFTLIELLIVITIIGVLAALLMANFIGVRQRARDGQRKSDLQQIRSALELYRTDSGSYPSSAIYTQSCPTSNSITNGTGTTVYIQKIPCDPSGAAAYNSGQYYYYYNSGTGGYTITACLENTADQQVTSAPVGNPSNCANNLYYTLQNP